MATLLKPIRMPNPGKKKKRMTAKQIKYFGTKRQRAALKNTKHKKRTNPTRSTVKNRRRNVGHILVASNPGHRRRNVEMGFYNATGFHPIRASRDYDSGRLFDDTEGSYRKKSKTKSKSRKRRKNPSMAAKRKNRSRVRVTNRRRYHRRRNPITNRSHRRRTNRHHRRRTNPTKVVVRYRNRSRTANRHHRHRRNPGFMGGSGPNFPRIAGVIGGYWLTSITTGMAAASLPSIATGYMGVGVSLLLAYIQGKLVGKVLKNSALGDAVAEGGYVYATVKLLNLFGITVPGLSGGRGMGLIAPSSFYVPQVPINGSMGSFRVPPGVPRPIIVNSGLKGIHNNAIGGGRMSQRRMGRMG